MTPEQQAALDRARAALAEVPQQPQANVGAGVARSVASGLTFGGADEAEAYIRSIFGSREYDDLLADIRGQVGQFQEQRPGLALGSELAGATLPAIIASLFTGGAGGAVALGSRYPMLSGLAKSAGIVAPRTLAGSAGYGAVQGAATGFLSGEGAEERIRGLVTGGAVGAGVGAGLDIAAKALQGTLGNFMDYTRRKLGNKGGSAVEQELQRIAAEAGITPEQAYIEVAQGRLMAENKTLQEAVRGYFDKGGPGAALLSGTARTRPGELRKELVEDVQEYLTDVAPGANFLRDQADKMSDLKEAAQDLYNSPSMQRPISDNALPIMKDIFQRAPEAFAAVKRELGVGGKQMFFEIGEDGSVNILRAPTIQEAEVVRRAINDLKGKYYKAGEGGTAQAYGALEQELRQAIDMISDETQQARATYNTMMDQGRAYEAGEKAFKATPDVDQIELDIDRFSALGDEALKAYRTGIMRKLRIAMTSKRAPSITADLANPDTALGKMMQLIFPGEDMTDLATKLQTQEGADALAKTILSKSPTSSSQQQIARQGASVGAEDIAEATTPFGMLRLLRKLTARTRPELTDSQREQVVQALLSQDPDYVKGMLRDESGMAVIQNLIQRTAEALYAGGRSGAIYGTTQNAPQTAQGVLGMVGPQ